MALSIGLRMKHAGKIKENEYHSEKHAVEKPRTLLSACKRGLLLKTQKSS